MADSLNQLRKILPSGLLEFIPHDLKKFLRLTILYLCDIRLAWGIEINSGQKSENIERHSFLNRPRL